MGEWLYKVNNEGQLRWLGPEKGVIAMAVAAIVNSLWDLRARLENKPVWKVLVDMTPEQLISLIDFTYVRSFKNPNWESGPGTPQPKLFGYSHS